MDSVVPLMDHQESIEAHGVASEAKAFLEMPVTSADKTEPAISIADTTNSAIDAPTAPPITTEARQFHIPYILNGELYVIQTQEGENVTVKCCNCPADRVYRGSVRSTGNFHMHIKRRHPDLLSKLHDMKVNALLERRDRFVRNRKSARRRSNANGMARVGSKFGGRLQTSAQTANCMLYTHKLKIKAAFQRHQLQQQQQQRGQEHLTQECSENLQSWGQRDAFVVAPIERAHDVLLVTEQNEQPLNYSMKHYDSGAINLDFGRNKTVKQCIEVVAISNRNLSQHYSDADTAKPFIQQQSQWSDANNNSGSLRHRWTEEQLPEEQQQNEHIPVFASNSDQPLYGRTTTLTAVTPCPSSVSSYAASNLSPSACNVSYEKCKIVKDELYTPQQPIDLSQQPSSNTSGSSGFGSTVRDYDRLPNNNNNSNITEAANIKCNQLLQRVANSLQGIQRQLQTYNQISSDRLRLEIAKFEYLHSDFNFRN